MHEGRTWFIPAFLSNYKEGYEPLVEDILLFTQEDSLGNDYIPVFDNSSHCDLYIAHINAGNRDKSVCIFAFSSLSDLENRVRKDFKNEVKLIIHTTDTPDGPEEELDLDPDEKL